MIEEQLKLDLDKYLKVTGSPFFKAKDMEKDRVKVKITNVREVNLPNSGLTLVLDFIHKKVERSLPLNVTNIKALKEKLGVEVNKWINQEITLVKVLVTNPKTRQEVESIRIR